MTIRCQCGVDNPDGAVFCNKCGKELEFQRGESKCPKCGLVNPEHVVFCGGCGTDLESAYAKQVATEPIEDPIREDAYVRWGNSHSLWIWGGTYSQTARQYVFRVLMSFILVLVMVVCLAVLTGVYLVPVLLLLVWALATYFWWWTGRRGAGA